MNTFEVGDLAQRIDRDLDARPVAAVKVNLIRLQIGTVVTPWLDAALYHRIPRQETRDA